MNSYYIVSIGFSVYRKYELGTGRLQTILLERKDIRDGRWKLLKINFRISVNDAFLGALSCEITVFITVICWTGCFDDFRYDSSRYHSSWTCLLIVWSCKPWDEMNFHGRCIIDVTHTEDFIHQWLWQLLKSLSLLACPSVCTHGRTQEHLNEFSLNLKIWSSNQIRQNIPVIVKICQK
jgi:hypothetical protein